MIIHILLASQKCLMDERSAVDLGPNPSLRPGCRASRQNGFTLIELMVAVAIVAILARIALPSYKNYVTKSRAQAATSDLVGMALAMENDFQKTLAYPAYASTTIPALPASRSSATGLNDFSAWSPAQSAYFSYAVSSSVSAFTVTATGNGSTMTSSCVLSLTNDNVRSAPADNSCGFTSW